ncbi:hypothetical protein, partial [Mesorhizobium sp.]|uniref:hypothetical protein n=1 Tax=Mesorhizobium sp. TaxID=1871066 RepID=UPI0025F0F6E2
AAVDVMKCRDNSTVYSFIVGLPFQVSYAFGNRMLRSIQSAGEARRILARQRARDSGITATGSPLLS